MFETRGRVRRCCQCGALAMVLLLVATAVEAATMYVLMVADLPDPKLGAYIQGNTLGLVTLLAENVRTEEYNIVTVPDFSEPKKDDLAASKILAAIANLPSGPDDTILLYYSGHGEYRDTDQHFLVTREGAESFNRSKIVAAVQKRKPRLAVVLTDASFAVVPMPVVQPIASAPIVPETKPLFKKLFFQAKGLINVNGCKPGQVAATCPDFTDGSIFTLSVRQVLDRESQSSKSWKEILAEIEQETADQFKKKYPKGIDTPEGHQTTQTVYRFAPVTSAAGRPQTDAQPGDARRSKIHSRQLGLTVAVEGGQIKVESVDADQPATRCVDGDGRSWTLQPGDVIAQINAANVTTIEEFATAVRSSPGKLELVVVGNSDHQNHRFSTTLNPRFGVSPQSGGENKVQVASVVPGSAAVHCSDAAGRQWRLEAGDVITSINGQPINSVDAFRKAIAASATKMRLTVMGADGQPHELSVTLGD